MTQAQLATALDVAPTSIYRYEAGTSTPDLKTIKLMANYARDQKVAWAHGFFLRLFVGEVDFDRLVAGPPFGTLSGGIPAEIVVSDRPLTPREQLFVIAFVLLLRNNINPVTEDILKVLLDPFMEKARAEFDVKTASK